MSDTTLLCCARDGGKFARFSCAGAPPQLQWGSQSEFPSVVRLFEFNSFAIALTVVRSGGIFPVPTRAVGGLDLGTISCRFLRGSLYRGCCRPREMQRSRGKLCTVSRVRGRRTGPCDAGNSGCFAKVKRPSATPGSHSAWSRCRHQSHPSPCQANSRRHTEERCASPPTSRSRRRTCTQSWLQFWTSPEAHTHWSSEKIPSR